LRADILTRGIPADKVTVIPNAVDIASFNLASPPDPGLQDRWGLTGKTVIGFVGSFYAYEGLDLLLEALPPSLKSNATFAFCSSAAGHRKPICACKPRGLVSRRSWFLPGVCRTKT
jgi:glycosyltransferase involved in cell wall biosynthesis